MRKTRRLFLAAAGLACLGAQCQQESDDPGPLPDHTYIASSLHLPSSPSEGIQLGLDIDEKANDGPDNQITQLLASLRTLAPDLDLQGDLDARVDQGHLVLLLNLGCESFTNSNPSDFFVYTGSTNMTPAACSSSADTVCRHHLDGTGQFSVEPSSANDRMLGMVAAGTFTGGPGNLTLPFSFFGGATFGLPLRKAKAELVAVGETGWSAGKIGGAISQDDIDGVLYPALAASAATRFAEECDEGVVAPSCGCAASSAGDSLRNLFDMNDDCTIESAEVAAAIDGLITFDIDLTGDGLNDAMSIGVGVSAVHATFTPPPE